VNRALFRRLRVSGLSAAFAALFAVVLAWLPGGPAPSSVRLADTAAMWMPASYEQGLAQVAAVGSAADPLRAAETRHAARTLRLPTATTIPGTPALTSVAWAIELGTGLSDAAAPPQAREGTASPATTGVLFTQIGVGGDFFLNGTWVASLPPSTEAVRKLWFRPLLIPLPPHLLRTDGRPDVLTMVQAMQDPYVSRWPLLMGSIDSLTPIAGTIELLSGTVANVTNLLGILAGLLLMGAWLASREKPFAWAGASIVLWSLLFLLAEWPQLPMPWYRPWRWAIYACIACLPLTMAMFVRSFVGSRGGRLGDRLMIAYACIGPLVYLLGGRATEVWLDRYWTGPVGLYYIYLAAEMVVHGIRTRSGSATALSILALAGSALSMHDSAVLSGNLASFVPEQTHWSGWMLLFQPIYIAHLGVPVHLLVMANILLHQYRTHARNVRNANATLQEALRRQEAELARSHEHRRRLTKAEAAQHERERIYQDIHDGIGSRLVSTLFALRQGRSHAVEIESQIERCISELRLVINAQGEQSDIQSAIFGYCMNLEAQLYGSGLELQYEIFDGPAIQLFPRVHLNVLRILQEAVTNVIKHAGANRLVIELLRAEETELVLVVTDNGRGLPRDRMPPCGAAARPSGRSGRGIAGFASRADMIGATCTVGPASPGTRVVLKLPLLSPRPDHGTAPQVRWMDTAPLAPYEPSLGMSPV
jgi:signal transduction histidine kinase